MVKVKWTLLLLLLLLPSVHTDDAVVWQSCTQKSCQQFKYKLRNICLPYFTSVQCLYVACMTKQQIRCIYHSLPCACVWVFVETGAHVCQMRPVHTNFMLSTDLFAHFGVIESKMRFCSAEKRGVHWYYVPCAMWQIQCGNEMKQINRIKIKTHMSSFAHRDLSTSVCGAHCFLGDILIINSGNGDSLFVDQDLFGVGCQRCRVTGKIYIDSDTDPAIVINALWCESSGASLQ